MIEIDDGDVKQLVHDLGKFAKQAIPYATRSTVNGAAFEAQKIAKRRVSDDMINRNKFTVSSVRVEQTRTLNVRQQQAVVGSIAPYMETQEFGGTKMRGGSEGTPIATSYSAGQGVSNKPRTRLPRRPNKLANVRLSSRRVRARTRAQRNLVSVKMAASSSSKYVFLDLGRRKGIFKVIGGKRSPKVRMVHDLTRTSVTINKNPWLKPSVDETRDAIPRIYFNALKFQAKRRGLFK